MNKIKPFLLSLGLLSVDAFADSRLNSLTGSDFLPRNENQEALGKVLFFDKILSGNRNISCATCHHPLTGTGDGLALPVGEGGVGLGVTRNTGSGAAAIKERVPRNAPPVFNLGAKIFTVMFHDGRVEVDATKPSGFNTPAGDLLPNGILTSVLAAQAMFPVTSAAEMAGHQGENPIADAAAANNLPQVWQLLAERLQAIPAYVDLFKQAFPADIRVGSDITYAHAAQAIAAFESAAWRTDNSRFDQYLRGQKTALTTQELRGMKLFYDKANCDSCHQGILQTDFSFHATAMPQIGPGKGNNLSGFNDGADDFGRERVTQNSADRFKFRTPTLRMVAVTGPWGHDGAYNSLRAMVKHELNPVYELEHYDTAQAVLPPRADLDAKDFMVQNNPQRRGAIGDASELKAVSLTEKEIDDLIAFLYTLTDMNNIDLRRDVPLSVPSGLPIAE